MSARLLLLLVLGNLFWSAHPTLAKFVLRDFSPLETAWLRYFGAFVAWLIMLPFFRRRGSLLPRGAKANEKFWIFAVGAACFALGPWMQVTGLAQSSAVDNALIVAMEPLLTVLLAMIFLREVPRLFDGLSFLLALAGFVVLSGGVSAEGAFDFRMGNMLLLLSLVGESSFSVLGRGYAQRFAAFPLFGGTMVAGIFTLTAIALWQGALPVAHFSERITWTSGLALLWLGPFGTTLSYVFWMSALSKAPVASVALTLLVQPLFGALWGTLFLAEPFPLAKQLGGGLILAGLLLTAWQRPAEAGPTQA